MNVREGIDGLRQVPAGSVMSIGNFDGLHRGHASILERMKSLRDSTPGSRIAIVTFEPHPLTVLRPELAPPRLTPYPIKQRLIEEAGADEVILIMQTETIPHAQALSSIELFGRKVIPACRAAATAAPVRV